MTNKALSLSLNCTYDSELTPNLIFTALLVEFFFSCFVAHYGAHAVNFHWCPVWGTIHTGIYALLLLDNSKGIKRRKRNESAGRRVAVIIRLLGARFPPAITSRDPACIDLQAADWNSMLWYFVHITSKQPLVTCLWYRWIHCSKIARIERRIRISACSSKQRHSLPRPPFVWKHLKSIVWWRKLFPSLKFIISKTQLFNIIVF